MADAKLGFPQTVKTAFSFLEDNFGFHIKNEEETLVRYENEKVFVNIYHGRISREIGLEFGLLGESPKLGHPTIEQLLLSEAPETYKLFRYRATQSKSEVRQFVHELRDLLQRYGSNGLLGDRGFFSKLNEVGVKQVTEGVQLDHAKRTRPQAEAAFRAGDYKKAAELYGSIEQSLTPTEVKKLAFARSKLR